MAKKVPEPKAKAHLVTQQNMTKQILLNFDLEEFDIPEEYGQKIDSETKIRVASEGLVLIFNLLEKLNITATFFTTAYFAQNKPLLLRQVASRHEVASHGVSHSEFKEGDLLRSRLELERLCGKKIYGFRQPRFESVNKNEILAAGYAYDSSENPIWLPGRYMCLFKPRLPYFSSNLVNLPISTSPIIRYPLFWLSFKNSPLWLFKIMSLWALEQDGYLNIVFHPWEFTDLSGWRLPIFVKRLSGEKMFEKFQAYLAWLKNKAEFTACLNFSEKFSRH